MKCTGNHGKGEGKGAQQKGTKHGRGFSPLSPFSHMLQILSLGPCPNEASAEERGGGETQYFDF